jgi:hypothetical protein
VIALPGELAFSVRKNIREKNFQLVEDMSSGREMSREPGFFLLRPSYSGESYDIDEIKTKMFVKGVGQKEVTEFLRYYNLGNFSMNLPIFAYLQCKD